METATATTAVAVRESLFSHDEERALVGFLAGYSGLTREAYALDLRQYVTWCTEHQLRLFGARRADIESFGRDLETLGRARRRSRGGYAPSPASTGTPKKKASSRALQQSMSAARDSTTSHTPPVWTATRSVPYSSPPASPVPETTRSSACWR